MNIKLSIVMTAALTTFNACNAMNKANEQSDLESSIRNEIGNVAVYTARAQSVRKDVTKQLNDFLAANDDSSQAFKEKVGPLADALKAVKDARALTQAISDAAEDYSNKFSGKTSEELNELAKKVEQDVAAIAEEVDDLQQELEHMTVILALPDFSETDKN